MIWWCCKLTMSCFGSGAGTGRQRSVRCAPGTASRSPWD